MAKFTGSASGTHQKLPSCDITEPDSGRKTQKRKVLDVFCKADPLFGERHTIRIMHHMDESIKFILQYFSQRYVMPINKKWRIDGQRTVTAYRALHGNSDSKQIFRTNVSFIQQHI